MKLLVLAQIPPPLHGQSQMVRTLLEGLPKHGIAVRHVNLGLSRDQADIGRVRPGKVLTLLLACLRTVRLRFRERCDTLYYVPAPAKRAALYRDWVVMVLCRPFFKKLVLHFHNGGLGEWLKTKATAPERWLTRWLLGRADLAIVLTASLREDAQALTARSIAVVPNGIPDPTTDLPVPSRKRTAPFQILFMGCASFEKGLFNLMDAVQVANRLAGHVRFQLTVAGSFEDSVTEEFFREIACENAGAIRHAGFVQAAAKHALFLGSDCLCLPTHYAHEGQPLVILEALAFDLPVVANRWRGIPDTLPFAKLLEPDDKFALPDALDKCVENPPPAGQLRNHFLNNYTAEHHLSRLAAALSQLA